MFLTEYNEEKVLEQERKEGIEETNERVAKDMLSKGSFTISCISDISKLSEEAVMKLAKTMGVAVQ